MLNVKFRKLQKTAGVSVLLVQWVDLRHLKAQREKRMLFILLCAFALPVTADRFSVNGWTMETPDMVMGREGKLVVLYCKFIHPHPQYKGNISIIWKEKWSKEPTKTFFKYTNYLSSGKYKNEIVDNVGARYRPMGDPRKNDASIIINQLITTDTNKGLNCRVELTQAGAKFQRPHGRITASGDVSASMVIGKRGGGATLNCNFKHSSANRRVITILWMKGTPWEESVVFKHTRSYATSGPGTDNVNRGGRYELVGNLDKGDASIRVRGLTLNDTNNYFCHVWTWNSPLKKNIQVTQDETGLQVLVDNDRASMVIGRKGATATLPCSFSPSIRNPSSITISWIKWNPPKWSVVFRDTFLKICNYAIQLRYAMTGPIALTQCHEQNHL
ncbi:uncharacterized protein LOC116971577 [Amblyraja radiata]|uniref:uncharacterized protein LOC116971577 n=1 Tax=Amblyraja radiata TaxID=386614 RepID=UPI00140387DE|nr:uncharacterized protein LOC116971577 [Amblyraja radiata]